MYSNSSLKRLNRARLIFGEREYAEAHVAALFEDLQHLLDRDPGVESNSTPVRINGVDVILRLTRGGDRQFYIEGDGVLRVTELDFYEAIGLPRIPTSLPTRNTAEDILLDTLELASIKLGDLRPAMPAGSYERRELEAAIDLISSARDSLRG